MNDTRFDTLARAAEDPRGRRVALKALGLAALGTVAINPLATEAKNKNQKKKRRKKNGGQQCPPEKCTTAAQQAAAAACQSQLQQCEARTRSFCGPQGPEQNACLELLLPCCQLFATCDVDGFFTCRLAAL